MTPERLLRLALGAVKEGLPLQQALLYPKDEAVWIKAVEAFVVALPDLPATPLTQIPEGVVIETLERAIEQVGV